MKKYLLSIMVIVFCTNSNSQSLKTEFANKIQISYKDILELKLQILALQITTGTYRLTGSERTTYPVSISVNYPNKIVFEIENELKGNLSTERQKSLIEEGFNFVKTAIQDLIKTNYPELNIDHAIDITGYWRNKNSNSPDAKWENEKILWVKQ